MPGIVGPEPMSAIVRDRRSRLYGHFLGLSVFWMGADNIEGRTANNSAVTLEGSTISLWVAARLAAESGDKLCQRVNWFAQEMIA
jgi:hypothetical protein